VRRRAFIAGLGGVAVCPLVGWAQDRDGMRRVGVLMGGIDNAQVRLRLTAFQQELQRLGWTDGANLRIDLRFAAGPNPIEQARELVQLRPDVIVAGPTNAFLPVQRETRTIPIVFVSVSDPLGQGFIESLSKPGGNATGFSNLEFSLIGKWLQLLKDASPAIRRVGLLIATSNASSPRWYQMFGEVAPTLRIEPVSLPFADPAALEGILTAFSFQPNSALIVAGDSVVEAPSVRRAIIDLAARHRLPALYGTLPFAAEGGLISYGIDPIDPFVRAASYVDRILKGEKPGDLPVQAPTKFHFVINLKTSKALGIELTPTIVCTAQ
jgi:putative tryptophan/tyrosine transport system substrate-binding protein